MSSHTIEPSHINSFPLIPYISQGKSREKEAWWDWSEWSSPSSRKKEGKEGGNQSHATAAYFLSCHDAFFVSARYRKELTLLDWLRGRSYSKVEISSLIFFSGTASTTKREGHHHAKENKHKKRAKMDPQAFSLSLLPSAATASGTEIIIITYYVMFLHCSCPSLWLC